MKIAWSDSLYVRVRACVWARLPSQVVKAESKYDTDDTTDEGSLGGLASSVGGSGDDGDRDQQEPLGRTGSRVLPARATRVKVVMRDHHSTDDSE
jgi:hypothetical protein